MDKAKVVYVLNRILFSHLKKKKKRMNMDGTGGHCVK
jgi:hypothetical protein